MWQIGIQRSPDRSDPRTRGVPEKLAQAANSRQPSPLMLKRTVAEPDLDLTVNAQRLKSLLNWSQR